MGEVIGNGIGNVLPKMRALSPKAKIAHNVQLTDKTSDASKDGGQGYRIL